MRRISHSLVIVIQITAFFFMMSALWAGILSAQIVSCEKCHTDEARLKSLYQAPKEAPVAEGEG